MTRTGATQQRFLAILDALADGDRWTPNQIGTGIAHAGVRVPTPFGHSGKRLGEGSSISPTLRAMHNRGWLNRGSRRDGLSGSAYSITAAGRAARTELRTQLGELS